MNGQERRIKEFTPIEYTDIDAIRDYITEKAENGWGIVSLGEFSEFERIEPQKIRFDVEILPTLEGTEAESDAGNSEERLNYATRDYLELCREAGWEHVCHYNTIYVFRATREGIPDILTDDAEKIEIVRKAGKKGLITLGLSFACCLNAVVLLANTRIQTYPDFSLPAYFANPADFKGMWFPMLFLVNLLLVAAAIIYVTTVRRHWVREAQRALEAGQPVSYYGRNDYRRRRAVTVLILSVYAALFIGVGLWGYFMEQDPVGPVVAIVILAAIFLMLFSVLEIMRQEWVSRKKVIAIICSALGIVGIATAVCVTVALKSLG